MSRKRQVPVKKEKVEFDYLNATENEICNHINSITIPVLDMFDGGEVKKSYIGKIVQLSPLQVAIFNYIKRCRNSNE